MNKLQTFEADTLYELVEPYDEDEPAYILALASETAADVRVADCWLFNASGELHPGYSVSPVPIAIEQMKRRIGRVVVEEVFVMVFQWETTG